MIDDEEVFHWITKEFIRRMDPSLEVMSFYNGQEALEYLEESDERPFRIFLDINMPVANGWVFLDHFKEYSSSEKPDVYVVSSSIDPEDMTKAQSYACVKEFVTKPLDTEVLERILKD